ncbi:MAG: cell division protein FtsZ [Alcanivorax sp.]
MINVKMQTAEVQQLSPKIAVIGVGGAGGNAVNNMISSNLDGCEFVVCNTDAQALNNSLAEHQVQLGTTVTGGLGAGSKPEVGQAAAEESLEEVLRFLDGANMAFVTAGMGGGTGTGAAPVIAKACRQQGILTVGVVTKPFHFEGVHRMEQAEQGIEELQQYVDTLIVIPNQNLFRIANEKTTFAEAFKMADSVLQSGVRGVTDLMVRPGLVNLDFADIKTAMMQMGKAMMGTGEASGDKRAIEAAEAAINNPLLDDVSMKGANGVIINVTGGYDMTLFEADEACNRIRDEVDPSANIIFGATFDDSLDGLMRVSIVATGIDNEAKGKVFGGGNGPGTTKPAPETLDRSAPSTVTAADKISSPISNAPKQAERPAAASLSGREVIKGLTAPKPISQPVVPQHAPQGQEAASLDMFEQGEFASETNKAGEPVLRGSTFGDSFIPPKPMQPDMKIPENGVGPHISNFHGEHVEKDAAPQMRSSKLQLNPPKALYPSASPQNKQSRTPSLFERITGSVQQHIDNLRDDSDMVKSQEASPADKGLESPSQETLDINKPAKPAVQIDEELDIPAFLRRQAN